MAGYCSISILPDDLIREISQCFLATNDLDAYVDFRAACRDWRRVIPNPRADAKDPKFIPTKWIMARHSLFEDGKVTFVNLSTGRSIRTSPSCSVDTSSSASLQAGSSCSGSKSIHTKLGWSTHSPAQWSTSRRGYPGTRWRQLP